MNIREAMYKAADHIEGSPQEFQYTSNDMPGCGTPGCMLGWTGVFLGVHNPKSISFASEVAEAIGTTLGEFINRAAEIRDDVRVYYHCTVPKEEAAQNAAKVLRLYADKYHPAESRALIPASVRAIFTMSPDQLQREFQRLTADELMAKFDETIEALKRA